MGNPLTNWLENLASSTKLHSIWDTKFSWRWRIWLDRIRFFFLVWWSLMRPLSWTVIGAPVPEHTGREARRHSAKASKCGISNEYIAICTGIQCDGGDVAETKNSAKPSAEELKAAFQGYIGKDTIAPTDGLRSYGVLETLVNCTVVDTNEAKNGGAFNLNTVNSLHSFIKGTYNNYRRDAMSISTVIMLCFRLPSAALAVSKMRYLRIIHSWF